MRRVYKYSLEVTDSQRVEVIGLVGAQNFKDQFMSLDVQRDTACLWYMVDTDQPKREILIRVIGTGHDMPPITMDNYLGSFISSNGFFVGHVFFEEI